MQVKFCSKRILEYSNFTNEETNLKLKTFNKMQTINIYKVKFQFLKFYAILSYSSGLSGCCRLLTFYILEYIFSECLVL